MALLKLIDEIDSLLSGGASISHVRNRLLTLREQAEAVEQRLSLLESSPKDEALIAERDRLKTLLDEAWGEIEHLQFEKHQNERGEASAEEDSVRPPVEHVTYAEILQSIEAVTPFQQPDVTKVFIGKRVSWLVALDSISRLEKRLLVFCALIEGRRSEFDRVVCWTSGDGASSLAAVQRGGHMRVEGTITDISGACPTLYDCTFCPQTTKEG